MAFKHKEVNPLELLNLRKLSYVPCHFETITITKNIDIKKLENWINFNLNNRYAIKYAFILDNNKKIINSIIIGFEERKELSIFSLSCPYL